MSNNISVAINARAYQKIRHWVMMAQGEVSGLGIVSERRDERGHIIQLVVDEVYLIKQQCSGTDTLLNDESIAQFLIEMTKQEEDVSKLKLWWHSHANMEVFWSSTDEQCIQGLANSSYMLSIVVNKKKNMLARIDVYNPFHLTLNKIETDVFYPDEPELAEFCKNEFIEKVTEHSFGSSQHSVFTRDDLIPSKFPCRDDRFDAEIEQLEYLVSQGKLSVEEYEERATELMYQQDMLEEMV